MDGRVHATDRSVRDTGGSVRRRGLLAGAAALAAAAVARLAGPERAEAGHTSLLNPEPLHIGVINDGTNATNVETASSITTTTVLVANGGTAAFRARQLGATAANSGVEGSCPFVGVRGQGTGSTNGTSGVVGESNVIGVRGFSISSFAQSVGVLGFLTTAAVPFPSYNTQAGVLGLAGAGLGAGVRGITGPDFTGSVVPNTGVHGSSDGGTGVRGDSESGVGVIGISTGAAGMYGFSSSGVGVFGTSPTNVGVFGQANQNAGVFGDSPVNGVWGRTTAGLGVKGEATGAGIGVYGRAGTNGWAGYFFGNVYVTGTLTQGGAAASPQAASSMTTEDVGEARLVNGRATVTLDEDVVAALDGDYRVFLTPEGDSNGLYVSRKGRGEFEVREQKGGTSSLTFNFRVVRGRKAGPGRRGEGSERPAARPAILDRKDVAVPTPPAPPETGKRDTRDVPGIREVPSPRDVR